MKISTKGRYALRMMLDLAVHSGGQTVSLRDIAARQGISEKYLEQIVTQLSRARLVRSVRGAGGGYLLTRPTTEYTSWDILSAVEGSMAPVDCVDGFGCCARADRCVTVEVWAQVHHAVKDTLSAVTLDRLVQRYHEKCG